MVTHTHGLHVLPLLVGGVLRGVLDVLLRVDADQVAALREEASIHQVSYYKQ